MHQTLLSCSIYGDEILKIFLSVLCGSILGFEREIRGKSAGFRTLALICFGSAIFTICSYLLGVEDNRDRIAANIITGVGFLGAGVIFRNNVSVSGITTAASIWVAAAIGMFIGIGEFLLAGISVVISLFVLYAMDYIQVWIDNRFQHRNYRVLFNDRNDHGNVLKKIKESGLNYSNMKVARVDQQITIEIEVRGKRDQLEQFNSWMLKEENISSFSW